MQRTVLLVILLSLTAGVGAVTAAAVNYSSPTRSPRSSPALISRSCRAIAAPATRPITSTRNRR